MARVLLMRWSDRWACWTLLSVMLVCIGPSHARYNTDSGVIDKEIQLLESNYKILRQCSTEGKTIVWCNNDLEDLNLGPTSGSSDDGTTCLFEQDQGMQKLVTCDDGEWKVDENTDNEASDIKYVAKRNAPIQQCTRSGRRWFRGRRSRCNYVNHAPYYPTGCTPVTTNFTTPVSSNTGTFYWQEPAAHDYEDGVIQSYQVGPLGSGSEFVGTAEGAVFSIQYQACDRSDACADCSFQINVRVRTCPQPTVPAYGNINCPNGQRYGDECSFTCASGFSPNFNTIQCMSSETWSAALECNPVECPQSLLPIENGAYNCTQYTYGSVCEPHCISGYQLWDDFPITCSIIGVWERSAIPQCRDANPPTIIGCPSSISITASSGSSSEVVTWTIPKGYDVEDGNDVVILQTTGSISVGSQVKGGTSHTVTYIAVDESGNESDECSFNVTVQVIRCPAQVAINNGFYECNQGFIYGSECTFSCLTNYQLQGSHVTLCEADGTWTAQTPVCTPLTCQSPESLGFTVTNGVFNCPSPLTVNTVCTSSCNPNYKQTTASRIICTTINGNASFVVDGSLSCTDAVVPQFINCSSPIVVPLVADSGSTSATAQWVPPVATDNKDASVVVKKVSGPNIGDPVSSNSFTVVEFQAVDADNNPSGICTYILDVTVIECDPLIPTVGSTITCNHGNIYGSTCTLSCMTGYEVSGSSSAECLQDGSWSETIGCTEVFCPTPPTAPANGLYECTGPQPYNSLCTPTCQPGFEITQGGVARCTENGNWVITENAICSDAESPVITDCLESVTLQALAEEESVVVNVAIPTAIDNVDGVINAERISGPANGDSITENTVVVFQARDSTGNPSERCFTQLIVQVITCPVLRLPANGEYTCTANNIFGSTCEFTCDTGYRIPANDTVTCQIDGAWSDVVPTCSPVTCQIPGTREYGSFQCPQPEVEYLAQCPLVCDLGFSSDTVYAKCEADSTWSYTSDENCIDTSPPVLSNCKSYQTFNADAGSTSVIVSWQAPTVADNLAGATLVQLSGPTNGTRLEAGEHFVEYQAMDLAGNPSLTTCTITLNVEVIECDNPLLRFTDVNLQFFCSDFSLGTTCNVTCQNTTSATYVLVGANSITCDASVQHSGKVTKFWNFDGNTIPSCEEIVLDVCPKTLHVPSNGAITYFNDPQPVAFVTCNEKWDLPVSSDGQFFCLDDGTWNPSTVYDCTFERFPGLDFLPASYHYAGDCSTTAAQDQIKNLVLSVMEEFKGTSYAPSCLATSSCDYSDVIVDCGLLKRKKKKQTAGNILVTIVSKMNGVVRNSTEFITSYTALNGMADALLAGINAGVFNVSGYEILPDSFAKETARPKCFEDGVVLQGLSCKACAVGTYLYKDPGSGTPTCRECPVGFYADHDAATECDQCPDGSSTLTTGSKSAGSCLNLCPAGQFSPTGLVPCTACPRGSYQVATGQKQCDPCPSQHTTYKTGSTQCTEYDVILDAGIYDATIHNLTSATMSYSSMFWLKKENDSSLILSAYDETSGSDIWSLYFHINSSMSVGGTSHYFDFPTSGWTHVAATFGSSVNVYINGDLLLSDITGDTVLGENSLLKVGVRSSTDIRISGYGFYDTTAETDTIENALTSCHLDMTSLSPVFSSDDLIGLYEAVPELFAEPTNCVATDPCLSSPCGEHTCVPEDAQYACVCKQGYTGDHCESPPNYCAMNDCKNGATCQNDVMNYTCFCRPGYTGHLCQVSPVSGGWSDWASWSQCTQSCDTGITARSRRCDNPLPDDHGVNCTGDWNQELYCNTQPCAELDPCAGIPCGPDNVCQVVATGYRCLCALGRTGNHCETAVDFCSGNPCLHGGTCTSNTISFACACPDGYTGTICQTEVAEYTYLSNWSPCTVSCGGGSRSRTRHCAQVTSSTCTSDVTETEDCNAQDCPGNNCDTSPCGTGSTCISTATGFTCTCREGYTGSTCMELVDLCADNPCKHGACQTTASGFLCACSDGYTGQICDGAPVDGHWSVWSDFGPCNTTCGTGYQHRSRECSNPPPMGGADCEGTGEEAVLCSVICQGVCEPNPCNNGRCFHNDSNSNGFTCHCTAGYTGETCQTPPNRCHPNPCSNGGTCSMDGTTFVCACSAGYSGLTCVIAPDASKWLPWNSWSSCSQSCGSGSRQRSRACAQSASGVPCEGSNADTKSCNLLDCPKCSELPLRQSFDTIKQCNTDTNGTMICQFSCPQGSIMSNMSYILSGDQTYLPIYACGPDTNFLWNNSRPLPSCSASTPPKKVSISFSMQIAPQVPCSVVSSLTDAYSHSLSGTTCDLMSNCKYTVSAAGCSSSIVKREAETTSDLTFEFDIDLGITTTGSEAEGEMTKTREEIMETTELIKEGSTESLTTTVEGVTYSVNTSTIVWQVNVNCGETFTVESEFMCVGCAPGSYYDYKTGYCEYCPAGTYQETLGQTTCNTCPDGFTHALTGSYSVADCTDPAPIEDSTNVSVIVWAVCGGTVGAFLVAAVFVFIYKKKSSKSKAITTPIQSVTRERSNVSILTKNDIVLESLE